MILPSANCARTTETVGFFETDAATCADWLVDSIGGTVSSPALTSLDDVCALLEPGDVLCNRLLLPVGSWTAMLTDGPLGTDVGMLPSFAALDGLCRAAAITAADPQHGRDFAAVFELYDPASTDEPNRLRRSVYLADEGGVWRFGEAGEPFEFEDVEAYRRRRRQDRFGLDALVSILARVGVPTDVEPTYSAALLVGP